MTEFDFRKLTDEELYAKMYECGLPGHYQVAVEELQRRYLLKVEAQVKSLNKSSMRMERLTQVLIVLTVVLIFLTAALLWRDTASTKSMVPMAPKNVSGEMSYRPNKTWIKAARGWNWSGLANWSDESIMKNLSTPAGFRAAFPEYATWNDDEIKGIAVQAPPIPYDGVPPGMPAGYTLDPGKVNLRRYATPEPGAVSVPEGWTR
jgi:hypothetical protein